jgi:hypothetical protein
VDKAEKILMDAEKLYRQYKPGWGWEMVLLISLFELYLEQGNMEKARQACKEALQHGNLCRSYMPDVLRLQGIYGWRNGKKEQVRKTWQKGLAQSVAQGQKYYEACIRREIGTYSEVPDELARAESIFAELGALPDLEKARAIKSATAER